MRIACVRSVRKKCVGYSLNALKGSVNRDAAADDDDDDDDDDEDDKVNPFMAPFVVLLFLFVATDKGVWLA